MGEFPSFERVVQIDVRIRSIVRSVRRAFVEAFIVPYRPIIAGENEDGVVIDAHIPELLLYSSDRLIFRQEHGQQESLLLVFYVRKFVVMFFRCLQRGVYCAERYIQEEGFVLVFLNKLDSLSGDGISLILLLVRDLSVYEDRRGNAVALPLVLPVRRRVVIVFSFGISVGHKLGIILVYIIKA